MNVVDIDRASSRADPDEIRRALDLITNGVFEIRIPKAGRHRTVRGYFNDRDLATKAVAAWSGKVPAVYVTLNPVNPALLARAHNRLETYAETTTSDGDILNRRWLLIDLDPKRPAGISASAPEHAAALQLTKTVCDWLHEKGWPDPIVADSGNGGHLLYRVALTHEADNTATIQRVLKALAARFDTSAVVIDQSVFNPSRISKLYGTWTCKGDDTADRPHRLSRILRAPCEPEPVALELLEELARQAPAPAPESRRTAPAPSGGDFFSQVNQLAMDRLSQWVPALFPAARSYHEGYRVTSRNLQRDCEEDLGIQPNGIKDFGVHDTGDPQSGRRTPIDLVIEHGRTADAKEAALWLCDQMGISPDRLGWLGWRKLESPRYQTEPPSGTELPPLPSPALASTERFPEFVPLSTFIAAPPKSSYLIKSVLPATGLGQVFGSSNVGKSFLLIDLAMHLASGRAWRGFKTKKVPVLYIVAEGMAGLAARMKAWTLRYGAIPDLLFVRPYSAQLTVKGAAAALAERMQGLIYPPRCIILDTLAANFGPGDENSAEDMAAAMNGLRALAGDWFALCAHHSGHADKTRGRGHSSLYAALDVELQVDRPDPLGPVKLSHTKCRDMERMEPLFFNLEPVALPWADEDGDPINSAVLVPVEGYEEPEKGPMLSGKQAQALQLLKDLYAEHQANLGAGGVARVTKKTWISQMDFEPVSAHRYRLSKTLEEKQFTREENGFVYLV